MKQPKTLSQKSSSSSESKVPAIGKESVAWHKKYGGKLGTYSKVPLKDAHDYSLAYTPGVAQVSLELARDPKLASVLSLKKNSLAVISDGSKVLGLGNLGAYGAIPVMEGKCVLFKELGSIDAFPICIQTQDVDEIISIIRNISPVFGAINLEDIKAPNCFKVEAALQDLGIPVFHDDQHGTAIVTYAALLNAARVAKKPFSSLRVCINGAGAAGNAITKMLLGKGLPASAPRVKEVIICDSKGIIHSGRADLDMDKRELAALTNPKGKKGVLADAIQGMDAFIGVSVANQVSEAMVRSMADRAIVLAMANPTPEIMPDAAKRGGAFVVGTGRSDYPNQVNNALAFPGIFRGAMDAGATHITPHMELAAAQALAGMVSNPTPEKILPALSDRRVAEVVAAAVRAAVKK
ncbi:MAG: NADP-dependent malic enzyme [Candidatus Iainarchaeum archaeon]|uniref:NADP-dependent malic enzyme n=1 Tax=Candidatus Iainarchaeum sp. TaxID=3101447 RepID=A0A7T9I268_9ARCH|nr:MAG: NADP-dependent malic enzyme [Candidatus Diapherotrites archaeon]